MTQEEIAKAACWVTSEVKSAWHGLSRKSQATLVFGASIFVTTLGKMIGDPATACYHWTCIRHDIGTAIGAGIAAVFALYMRPGPGPHAGETPYLGSPVPSTPSTTSPAILNGRKEQP
jgi:hypothetical protein